MRSSSSRAAAPPALALRDAQPLSVVGSPNTTLGSAQTQTPIDYPRSSSVYSPATAYQLRKDSSATTSTTSSGFSLSSSSSKKPKSHKNANSYCGRHTDQFLFGGFVKMWTHITSKKN